VLLGGGGGPGRQEVAEHGGEDRDDEDEADPRREVQVADPRSGSLSERNEPDSEAPERQHDGRRNELEERDGRRLGQNAGQRDAKDETQHPDGNSELGPPAVLGRVVGAVGRVEQSDGRYHDDHARSGESVPLTGFRRRTGVHRVPDAQSRPLLEQVAGNVGDGRQRQPREEVQVGVDDVVLQNRDAAVGVHNDGQTGAPKRQ